MGLCIQLSASPVQSSWRGEGPHTHTLSLSGDVKKPIVPLSRSKGKEEKKKWVGALSCARARDGTKRPHILLLDPAGLAVCSLVVRSILGVTRRLSRRPLPLLLQLTIKDITGCLPLTTGIHRPREPYYVHRKMRILPLNGWDWDRCPDGHGHIEKLTWVSHTTQPWDTIPYQTHNGWMVHERKIKTVNTGTGIFGTYVRTTRVGRVTRKRQG